MFTTNLEPKTVTIKPNDPNYMISNGLNLTPRAHIDINPRCPTHYANLVAELYSSGMITPVAVVTDKEYTLMSLRRK